MIELSLIASLFFLVIAVIASYLLKASLKMNGISESIIEKTTLIAIGLPPISSVKAKLIMPESSPQELKEFSTKGKMYLYIVRSSFYLSVLSIAIGIIIEL